MIQWGAKNIDVITLFVEDLLSVPPLCIKMTGFPLP